MTKKVLITGVTGQDGSNLVDYLLKNTDYQTKLALLDYYQIKITITLQRI